MGRMISNYFFKHGVFLCVIVRDEECLLVCDLSLQVFVFRLFFSFMIFLRYIAVFCNFFSFSDHGYIEQR